jgi:eukaryotic-like serine/threonine-protein kinase
MALLQGIRLGPYEVVGPLGAGGMGEVYRAKDTKLGREVALKLLPEHLAQDPERLARFEREARTLAALNHPHIAQVYGLEDAPSPTGSGAGLRALVMELVEGPTLAERIASLGAPGGSTRPAGLPLDEALPIAQQIAEALEAAHDQGIVHRDLKPANIKVRPDGTVKVLDFGLAKVVDGHASTATADESPTITSPAMTMRGEILGTAAYMSPEQAKGKPVDRRADIWAFGCVLFEMLTGRRAFEGEDVSDTLAAVLRAEPAWDALPAKTPGHVRTLLARCIERDVRMRLPHIGVARLELADPGRDSSGPGGVADTGPTRRRLPVRLAWVTAAAAVAAAVLALLKQVDHTAPVESIRFRIDPPVGHVFPGATGVPRFALSADGTAVVFAASEIGTRDRLFIRLLGEVDAEPVEGTESPALGGDLLQQPVFSPDGRYVAYFSSAESALKRVPAAGGTPERLAGLPTQNCGGSWHGEVILVASQGTGGVMRVPANGGEPVPVTRLDVARGETAHLWPQFLPDGNRFIYLVLTRTGAAIYAASIDGSAPVELVRTKAMARFAAPDQLLFVRGTALMAQTLDMATLGMRGEPTVVVDRVMVATNTRVGVSTSDDGTLVVAQGRGGGGNFEVSLRDRTGAAVPPGVIESPVVEPWVRLSPDGRFVAFQKGEPAYRVWVKDIGRGVSSRVSTGGEGGSDRLPIWSNDGRRLVFQSDRARGGPRGLYVRDAAGLTPEAPVVVDPQARQLIPEDWSLDGQHLLFRALFDASNDLLTVAPGGQRDAEVYLRDGFRNRQASFSPDGKWVAYAANESAPTQQVFVRAFPDASVTKIQVSGDGGSMPRWRRDGRELYFVDGQSQLVAVSVTWSSEPVFGRPVPLFRLIASGDVGGAGIAGASYDVSADGTRFVVAEPRGSAASTTLIVAINWMNDLKK